MSAPAISVILTTYDRPLALACTLEGYCQQDFTDFEIILGDDGSGEETKQVVEQYKERLSVPLVHVWTPHEDHGRTKVINNAVRHASGSYYVFSDGDCIPETNFLSQHHEAAESGYFCCGRRLMMSKKYRDITPEQVREGKHRKVDVEKSRRDIAKRERKSWLYKLLGDFRWDRLRLLGANFSMHKMDYYAVNGFDEGYVGWGAADEDLRRRLHDLGIKWKSVMSTAHVWHISHPPIASKPDKVKDGRNAGRYDSWLYLIQPIKGIDHRYGYPLKTVDPDGDGYSGASISTTAPPKKGFPRSTATLPNDVAIALPSFSDGMGGWNSKLGRLAQIKAAIIPPESDPLPSFKAPKANAKGVSNKHLVLDLRSKKHFESYANHGHHPFESLDEIPLPPAESCKSAKEYCEKYEEQLQALLVKALE